ncbi:hypothetical protein Tco_0804471 [Tanacetum coccineum]|uniref:Uncharacterized protein n=1 Tax=Tanacetum coccineum TaxID=301880 RepID=A0ABQ5A8X4_9ASTR
MGYQKSTTLSTTSERMKDIPVIVLSDDDSDAPVTTKRRRLVKNGAIVKKNYVQAGKNENRSNEKNYQRKKKAPLIVISDDDDDELDDTKTQKHKTLLKKGRIANLNDLHMTFLDKKNELQKKKPGKEVQKIDNVITNDESTIGFNTDKKKDPSLVSKSPTNNLIDEPTDEEFSDSVDLNEDFTNLFDEKAIDDAELIPETLTKSTLNLPSLDDLADATAEDLYDSDMYSVRSVSDGYEEDSFINDDSTDYYDTDDDI